MKIVVFGTGGVGGYFGARLAQSGEDVTFIARGEHLGAIRENGLRIESILGNFAIQPAKAGDNPSKIGLVDLVILGVKAWQVPDAAEAIKPLIGAQTIVLPLQNGVSAPSQLETALGREHVLAGLCRISVMIPAPGVIRHIAIQPMIAFGELDAQPSQRVESLRQVFAHCQGLTVMCPRILTWHYRKSLYSSLQSVGWGLQHANRWGYSAACPKPAACSGLPWKRSHW